MRQRVSDELFPRGPFSTHWRSRRCVPWFWPRSPPTKLEKTLKSISSQRWKTLKLRDTTRGPLKVRIFKLKVYVWDGESKNTKCWHLIVTKSLGFNPDTKISLTNAPKNTTLRRLGFMQRQGFWIERVFEDAKSECGMADYQVRKWNAWHHHMALVMMAMSLCLLNELIIKILTHYYHVRISNTYLLAFSLEVM